MNDYLKYWRVIRYFVKAKYKLNTADLEMLLFLYSEGYFSKDKFKEFDRLLSWDVNRFDRLKRDDWIVVFRKHSGKRKALYGLSYKAKRMIDSVYKKLNGEEIPVGEETNPLFARNVSYSDKRYKEMIENMNRATRQLQHRSHE